MFRSKNILWITFAFCLTTVSCKDYFVKTGSEAKMDCVGADPKKDIEWKVNNALVLSRAGSGRQRKGTLDTTNRARIEGTMLKITQLKTSDKGVYKCGSSSYNMVVASAYANPPSVLHSSETTLSCDVAGDFKGTFEWFESGSKSYGRSKDVTVKSVTLDNARNWICKIRNDKSEEMISLEVNINVVGPLKTPEEAKTHEGGSAELQCNLPATSQLPIIGGSWKREPHSDIRFPVLVRKQNGVQWNNTDVSHDRVSFTEKEVNTDFSVTLKKVKLDDAGVYVCSLTFENGKVLTSSLNLRVSKSDTDVLDPKKKPDNMWNKRVWGMQLWVWIAVSASSFVLIGLVVIILLIHRRNKRMKRKMKKLKSMRQPHKSNHYCKCDRPVSQAGTGKRGRPPPLPRHQYSSLNE
ncbi:hypothetical protein AMELA_G00082280 [Ameiurus melas]|uniref:Ig-like domain-containing protein n=1 Tax=Ameiurus melas TaxID=219545 RepID=A0A7J6B0C0_AMEME|nr:hypothetical protein AMELA_G00082280 [Ameiurus melas]